MACTMPKKGSLCGTGGRVGTDPASEACAAGAGSSDITKIDNALLSNSRARSDERIAIPPPKVSWFGGLWAGSLREAFAGRQTTAETCRGYSTQFRELHQPARTEAPALGRSALSKAQP